MAVEAEAGIVAHLGLGLSLRMSNQANGYPHKLGLPRVDQRLEVNTCQGFQGWCTRPLAAVMLAINYETDSTSGAAGAVVDHPQQDPCSPCSDCSH